MDEQPVTLAGAALAARASGALWWPEERLLCVADLHLGKSERLARRGGPLLPPYETAETLDRLAAEIAALAPASRRLPRRQLRRLRRRRGARPRRRGAPRRAHRRPRLDLDRRQPRPRAPSPSPGRHLAELRAGPLTFRHAALPDAAPGEVSGHYHPKLRLPVRGGAVTRPCFLADATRLILPAFGAYTGGLFASAPALARLLAPDARAILTGAPCVSLPLAALA